MAASPADAPPADRIARACDEAIDRVRRPVNVDEHGVASFQLDGDGLAEALTGRKRPGEDTLAALTRIVHRRARSIQRHLVRARRAYGRAPRGTKTVRHRGSRRTTGSRSPPGDDDGELPPEHILGAGR